MFIRIGIVEDEEEQFLQLSEKVKSWTTSSGNKVNITHIPSAEAFLFQYDQPESFDILILDIYMQKMTGMELAKKVREFDRRVQIMFLTGVTDYVLEGYEIGAVRYLVKPVDSRKLVEALNASVENLSQKVNDYFSIKYKGENQKINRGDIIYIQVNGHYLSIVTKTSVYEWKESLQTILKLLDAKRFVLANRSAVVNLEYVSKITREDCFMDNGDIIPVSRRAYSNLNNAFVDCFIAKS